MNEGIMKSDDDSSSNPITRTTIREANYHLQLLHKRNQELEELANKQKLEIQQKDYAYMDLLKSYHLLEKNYRQLQLLFDERTRRLNNYERKETYFRETLELKPAIESLLDILNAFEKEDRTTTTVSTSMQISNQKKSQNNVQKQDTV